MLTGSIFMLEVYDRVIPSRSVSTLIALLLLAGGLYAALGMLDLIRGRSWCGSATGWMRRSASASMTRSCGFR